MFLKELFLNNKKIFFGLVFFVITTAALNYKHGMTLYPIVHYGMYSGLYHTNDTILYRQLVINNDTLDCHLLNDYNREMVHFLPNEYQINQSKISTIHLTFDRLINKISPIKLEFTPIESPSEELFSQYYTLRLQKILKKPIKHWQFITTKYIWQNNTLKKI